MNKIITSLVNSTLLLTISCSISCKKANIQHNQQDTKEKAINWYLDGKTESITVLKSNKGDEYTLKTNIHWDEAEVLFVKSHSTVYVPLEVSNKSDNEMPGNLTLIIYDNCGKYTSMLINSLDKRSVSKEVQRKVENALQSNNSTDIVSKEVYPGTYALKRNKTKIMNAPVPRSQNCTDWYYVTTYYDEYGNFLYDDVEYAYTTCNSETSGGEGTPQNPSTCEDVKKSLDVESASTFSNESNFEY